MRRTSAISHPAADRPLKRWLLYGGLHWPRRGRYRWPVVLLLAVPTLAAWMFLILLMRHSLLHDHRGVELPGGFEAALYHDGGVHLLWSPRHFGQGLSFYSDNTNGSSSFSVLPQVRLYPWVVSVFVPLWPLIVAFPFLFARVVSSPRVAPASMAPGRAIALRSWVKRWVFRGGLRWPRRWRRLAWRSAGLMALSFGGLALVGVALACSLCTNAWVDFGPFSIDLHPGQAYGAFGLNSGEPWRLDSEAYLDEFRFEVVLLPQVSIGDWVSLTVPLWPSFVIVSLLLIGALSRPRGTEVMACAFCGYCLAGLPTRAGSTTCPECGSVVAESKPDATGPQAAVPSTTKCDGPVPEQPGLP